MKVAVEYTPSADIQAPAHFYEPTSAYRTGPAESGRSAIPQFSPECSRAMRRQQEVGRFLNVRQLSGKPSRQPNDRNEGDRRPALHHFFGNSRPHRQLAIPTSEMPFAPTFNRFEIQFRIGQRHPRYGSQEIASLPPSRYGLYPDWPRYISATPATSCQQRTS
jgi:hypothetical protein